MNAVNAGHRHKGLFATDDDLVIYRSVSGSHVAVPLVRSLPCRLSGRVIICCPLAILMVRRGARVDESACLEST